MLLQDFNKTVADIVRLDYRTTDVFEKYGIDCCNNKLSLLETCTSKNLDYNSILNELDAASRTITISNALPFHQWKIDFLIEYIVNVHHAYLNLAVPALENALVSFIEGHKQKDPSLYKILFMFRDLSVLLVKHSRHEEEIIFPYIRQIETTHRRKEVYGNLFVRTLRKPLSNIEKEHALVFATLKEIQSLTNNYNSPANACAKQEAIYHKLKEFHNDMKQHTHLEDTILFPKAIEMEKELLQL